MGSIPGVGLGGGHAVWQSAWWDTVGGEEEEGR